MGEVRVLMRAIGESPLASRNPKTGRWNHFRIVETALPGRIDAVPHAAYGFDITRLPSVSFPMAITEIVR